MVYVDVGERQVILRPNAKTKVRYGSIANRDWLSVRAASRCASENADSNTDSKPSRADKGMPFQVNNHWPCEVGCNGYRRSGVREGGIREGHVARKVLTQGPFAGRHA